jgi:peptidoglycan hydrolase-like protein with peptidoglycan-binding domain
VYGRPIFPLGQLYGDPHPSEVERFRELAATHGASGVSWWSWQSASPAGWTAIVAALPPIAVPPLPSGYPKLARGTRGDVVVSAQERLISAGQEVKANGVYGSTTEQAVRNLQAASGLPVTGELDATSWPALLPYPPATIDWTKDAQSSAAAHPGANGPRSARLPAIRNELAPSLKR